MPVQGAVCLLEVQEYITENILPHGLYMLEQLGLDETVPIPLYFPETMKYLMKPDFRCEVPVEEAHDILTEDLQKTNPIEVPDLLLCNHHYCLPFVIIGDIPTSELFLENSHHLPLMCFVWLCFPCCAHELFVEVFLPHNRRAYRGVEEYMSFPRGSCSMLAHPFTWDCALGGSRNSSSPSRLWQGLQQSPHHAQFPLVIPGMH